MHCIEGSATAYLDLICPRAALFTGRIYRLVPDESLWHGLVICSTPHSLHGTRVRPVKETLEAEQGFFGGVLTYV